MITHAVWFRLRHPPGSPGERAFLEGSRRTLGGLPGVQDFTVLRQTSAKAPWTHGFSMVFADRAAYAAYNAHPTHVDYVRTTWANEVADFQEVDSVVLEAPER